MELKKRISFWDNFKGILIFLVVFTHFLYNFTNIETAKYIVNIIYFFHMPAFIFISGYFSKKDIDFSKFLKYIIIYLIFNSVFVIYTGITTKRILGLTPFYSYWYLLALIAWRLIAKQIKTDKWYIVIPICFIISLISGFFADVSNVLAIEKILGFLPFFFIGYYLPKDLIISFTEKRKAWVYIAGLIILVISLSNAFFISHSFDIQDYLLMETYTKTTDIFIRLLVYIIALVASFGLFCIIPNKTFKYNLFEKFGKNSLWIYVFHRPLTLIFSKLYTGPDNLYITICFIISILVCLFFSSNKLASILDKYLNKVVDYVCPKNTN